MLKIQRVAVIGSGSIGASWAALFLAQGLTVTAYDVNPAAETFMCTLVRNALPILQSTGLLKKTDAKAEDIAFTTDLAAALRGADFVQENGPERLDLKRRLFNDMAAHLGPDAIIATSSSGLTCSSIQEGMEAAAGPQRCIVGHPFNPPHLIPLVEVVGGSQTDAQIIDGALAFYASIGKHPVHIKKEIQGHVANRLQGALLREVMYLLQEDVCTVADIDAVMDSGPGLRWGVMGPNLLFHLGGGEGGVQHMADHLLEPLTSFAAPETPVIDDDMKKKWIDGTLEAVGGRSYHDLAKQRDEALVELLNMKRGRNVE